MYIYPDNAALQYSGRIDFGCPAEPVFVYAASYVKLIFTGTFVKVKISNRRNYWTNYIGYILDGVQGKFALDMEQGAKVYTIAENLKSGRHELLLFKRMDSCHIFTLYGFELEDGAEIFLPEPKPERRMEVFGDSVSCGEVSEALEYVGKPDPEHDGEYSNSWYSYAWITARKLGAELHDTSQGGIALLDHTGWFMKPDYLGVESCYDKLEYCPALSKVKAWDFKKYQPQVVVVAIGQNDNHPVDYMAENYQSEKSVYWRKRYQEFIEKLMELYPDSQIILTTTILMHDKNWDTSIEEVCRRIDSSRVHHFMYQKNGSGTPGHIRIPEAEEMAEELSAYINSLGDIWR